MLALIVFRLVGGSSQREEKLLLVGMLGSLVQLQIGAPLRLPQPSKKKKRKTSVGLFFAATQWLNILHP